MQFKGQPWTHPCQSPRPCVLPFKHSTLSLTGLSTLLRSSGTLGIFLYLESLPAVIPAFFAVQQDPSLARALFQHRGSSPCLSLNKLILKFDFQCNVIEKGWIQEVIRMLRDINACLLEASPYSFRSTLIATELCCHEARSTPFVWFFLSLYPLNFLVWAIFTALLNFQACRMVWILSNLPRLWYFVIATEHSVRYRIFLISLPPLL